MGYIVPGRVEVSLFFSDAEVEYPLEAANVLNFLHIGTSFRFGLPSIHFSVTDQSRILSNTNLLQDGAPIRVVIKALNSNKSRVYRFRLFKMKKTPALSGTTIEVDGYWDSPKYWLTSTSTGIRGTSNSVISEIAEMCGLRYEGVTTSDDQLWMPQNRTYCEFARAIAKHGWINNESFMQIGMDLSGVLHYKNLNAHSSQEVYEIVQGTYEEGKITSVSFDEKSSSGFNNRQTGYWNTRYQQSAVIPETTSITHKELVFRADSRSPLYSDHLKNESARGRQLYSPIDCGNVHESYELAEYQNLRYANLMNMGVDILTQFPTDLDISNVFNFVVRQEDNEIDNVGSGLYTCSSKALVIQGPNYFEKFEGYRHGTNLQ